MLERYERMIEHYKTWYPLFYEKTVDYEPVGMNKIRVYLSDGSILEFNSFDNTIMDVTKFFKHTCSSVMNEVEWRKELGRRLRHMIAHRGINQESLAESIGISRQMLNRYIRGTSTPSGYTISRLARALGCDDRELTSFSYLDSDDYKEDKI